MLSLKQDIHQSELMDIPLRVFRRGITFQATRLISVKTTTPIAKYASGFEAMIGVKTCNDSSRNSGLMFFLTLVTSSLSDIGSRKASAIVRVASRKSSKFSPLFCYLCRRESLISSSVRCSLYRSRRLVHR